MNAPHPRLQRPHVLRLFGRILALSFALAAAPAFAQTVPATVEGDADDDGVHDDSDECPREREDLDGTADSDGCPDPDDDGDGILDVDDLCPTRAEDMDGDRDADGCPDDDRDGDGIDDGADACPEMWEDDDGYEDDDGCPEDNWGDAAFLPDTSAVYGHLSYAYWVDAGSHVPGIGIGTFGIGPATLAANVGAVVGSDGTVGLLLGPFDAGLDVFSWPRWNGTGFSPINVTVGLDMAILAVPSVAQNVPTLDPAGNEIARRRGTAFLGGPFLQNTVRLGPVHLQLRYRYYAVNLPDANQSSLEAGLGYNGEHERREAGLGDGAGSSFTSYLGFSVPYLPEIGSGGIKGHATIQPGGFPIVFGPEIFVGGGDRTDFLFSPSIYAAFAVASNPNWDADTTAVRLEVGVVGGLLVSTRERPLGDPDPLPVPEDEVGAQAMGAFGPAIRVRMKAGVAAPYIGWQYHYIPQLSEPEGSSIYGPILRSHHSLELGLSFEVK